jgi:hypothetical protein
MTGWQLRTRAGTSTSDGPAITLSGTIPAKHHFLIASSAYGSNCEGVTPDFIDSNTNGLFGGMSDTTGRSIALFDGTSTTANKIDGFSFLNGATNDTNYYRDGTAFGGSSGSATVSFARKNLPGELYYADTENNAQDLQNVTSKSPKNALIFLPVTVSSLSME